MPTAELLMQRDVITTGNQSLLAAAQEPHAAFGQRTAVCITIWSHHAQNILCLLHMCCYRHVHVSSLYLCITDGDVIRVNNTFIHKVVELRKKKTLL